MITLLSPAKSLDFESPSNVNTPTEHVFPKETMQLIRILKKYKNEDLRSLMKISEKLADQNRLRYKTFSKDYTSENSKSAIEAFIGDVYVGLEAKSFKKNDLKFAQKHLRILSGLYGILKPFDKIQPYRLEMGTKLENKNGSNLYHFWASKINKELEAELNLHKSKYIVNLASNEYFKATVPKSLKSEVINVGFKEEKDGKLKFISFNAKKARGMMARFIVQNRIDTPDLLKGFDTDGYYYEEKLSDSKNLLFVR